ncbi:MAG: DUF3089 domain-containing protein [Myxococcota bacterium]
MLLSGLLLVGCTVAAAATADRWLMTALDPGPFDPAATPPAPDYTQVTTWAAHPSTTDGADAALPEAPKGPAHAPADAFYLHPTTFVAGSWNAAIDDPEVVQATHRGGTLIQASAFNACCAVYGPRYRQAHGRAFVDPDPDGAQAIEIAYADVRAAFEVFAADTDDRPFVLVGHSQGAILGARLLREQVVGTPLQPRLVAAYLLGGPLGHDDVGGLPACASAEQTGCVVAYNARGPNYAPNGLEFDADDPETMRRRICVNPLTWRLDGAHAPSSAHAGAVFFDTESPAVVPAFADAQCIEGQLVVTTMGDPQRDLLSRILLWMMGPDNYHPIEVQLFYLPLRHNAITRVAAMGR